MIVVNRSTSVNRAIFLSNLTGASGCHLTPPPGA